MVKYEEIIFDIKTTVNAFDNLKIDMTGKYIDISKTYPIQEEDIYSASILLDKLVKEFGSYESKYYKAEINVTLSKSGSGSCKCGHGVNLYVGLSLIYKNGGILNGR